MSDRNDTSPNLTLYPLFWLAVCFAFGILSGNFLNFGWQIYLTICLLSAILSAVFIKRTFTVIFLFVAFIAAGALYFHIENQTISPIRIKRLYDETRIKSGDPIEIEGVLQTKPELAVGGFFLILKTEKAIYKETGLDISGNVRLFAAIRDEQIKSEYDRLDLNYGSRIRVACNLRREDNYLNLIFDW
jgi:hypothetical protein